MLFILEYLLAIKGLEFSTWPSLLDNNINEFVSGHLHKEKEWTHKESNGAFHSLRL
jgi:hypothetical protein